MWHANDKKSVGRNSPADYEGKRCSAVSYSTGKLGKNKVEWYVVECERHFDDPNGAVKPSFQFLRSKGRC